MTLCVVVLDMQEVRGVLESWDLPVQCSHPFVDMRVARTDILQVRLEMLNVYKDLSA